MPGKATVNVDDGLKDIRWIRPWSRGREVAHGVLPSFPKPEKKVYYCHRRGIEILSPDTFFSWRYTHPGPPEPKIIYSTSPGPALPTDATPKTRSVLGGPSPEEGTPRVSGEPSRHKGSAHTSPEGRGLRPHARGAPRPTSTRSVVSRRHEPRGDQISRTGFQCGQFLSLIHI